jgi:hypothetical protein
VLSIGYISQRRYHLFSYDSCFANFNSTRLHMDEKGEPLKTNLGSTITFRKLIDRKPLKVHVVSTAYVCGLIQGDLVTESNHPRGDFVNVYEESKWEADTVMEWRSNHSETINHSWAFGNGQMRFLFRMVYSVPSRPSS